MKKAVRYNSKLGNATTIWEAIVAGFAANGVADRYIDVDESLRKLKDFLTLRDSLPVFDHCKEIGDIGLSAMLREDGTALPDWEG